MPFCGGQHQEHFLPENAYRNLIFRYMETGIFNPGTCSKIFIPGTRVIRSMETGMVLGGYIVVGTYPLAHPGKHPDEQGKVVGISRYTKGYATTRA